MASVYIVCVFEFQAFMPQGDQCFQHIASMLCAIVGCSVGVMLVIPLKCRSFVSVAVQIAAQHNLFV